ncbi:MAG: hypothetical protein Kow0059_20880 [Candidatus Sumerlaeia bacterium]
MRRSGADIVFTFVESAVAVVLFVLVGLIVLSLHVLVRKSQRIEREQVNADWMNRGRRPIITTFCPLELSCRSTRV